MDSLVWAMSVMTPSEMMSRMKYCEPSVTAEAYLDARGKGGLPLKPAEQPSERFNEALVSTCQPEFIQQSSRSYFGSI